METNYKDFILNNGLNVNGPASIPNIVVNNTLISIDSQTKRIKANVNNQWLELALLSDIPQAVVNNIEVQYDGN